MANIVFVNELSSRMRPYVPQTVHPHPPLTHCVETATKLRLILAINYAAFGASRKTQSGVRYGRPLEISILM